MGSADPVSSSVFREALSRFASGVTVVAVSTPGGPVGFTATGFSSLSIDPPLVLVCVGAQASAHDALVGADRFGVSILADRQRAIAEQLARSRPDRFQGVPLATSEVPLVQGALAGLECAHHSKYDAGDHTILVGVVVRASCSPGEPLVHYARSFGRYRQGPAQQPARGAPRTTVRPHAVRGRV